MALVSCQMPGLDPAWSKSSAPASAVGAGARDVAGAAASTTVVIGEPNIVSIDDYQNGNLLLAQQATLAQSATIQSLSFYVTTAKGLLRLGIYDASGPAGAPGAKVAETPEITPVVGWNTAAVTTPVLLSAGTYWLAYLPSVNGLHFRRAGAGTAVLYSYAYGQMPQTFSTTVTSVADHWSFYATLSTAGTNNPPSVATAATATPNPVNGTTTNVSVLGADDSGESTLSYSWSATGPAAVTFTPNASNAAKSSVATFASPGSYVLQASITDAQGLTVTSSVNVTVNQAIVIGEPNILPINDSQNGNLLLAQQASLGQAATIQSLSFYVTTAKGLLRLGIYDASGPAGAPGAKVAETAEITPVVGWNTAAVTTPVLLSAGTYWLAYLPSVNGLHFRRAGAGTAVLYSYAYGQMPQTFSTTVTSVADHWSFYAVLSTGGQTGNNPPSVATAATATPSPVNGTTTNVNVMGADSNGESALTYTWSATGPAAVTFAPNASNAAKSSVATFSKAGAYVLQASITDAQGLSVTSSVNVTVNQALASMSITPASATVAAGATQQYTGWWKDQFGAAMQSPCTWAVAGGGSISSTGLFTAGGTSGGPFTVTATSGSLQATAAVTVSASAPAPVSFAWDSTTDPTVTGYKFYTGSASCTYGTPVNVGLVTSYTSTGLLSGHTYYFAVTAYNSAGQESGYSTEVCYTVP